MTNRDEKIEEFWLPFCVTFIITVLSVAAMCLVRYNISSDSESVIEFHNVQCVNYIWLAVYMIAEALVPTMITFAISDSLAYRRREKENGKFFMKLTFCIAFLVCLGVVQKFYGCKCDYDSDFFVCIFYFFCSCSKQ